MDRKAALKRLRKLAQEQYEIIEKLAGMDAPAQNLPINKLKHGKDSDVIMAALPPVAKLAVKTLEVVAGMNEILVKFLPGKASQAAYDAILATVTKLQNDGILTGSSYKVTVSQ